MKTSTFNALLLAACGAVVVTLTFVSTLCF